METREIILNAGVWTSLTNPSTGVYALQNKSGNPINIRFSGSTNDGYTIEPGMGMSSSIFGEGTLEAWSGKDGKVVISY